MPESTFQGLPFPQALQARDKATPVSQLETTRHARPLPQLSHTQYTTTTALLSGHKVGSTDNESTLKRPSYGGKTIKLIYLS